MSRKKIIAGNWKMNVKPSETAALIKGVAEATAQFAEKVEVVYSGEYAFLDTVKDVFKQAGVKHRKFKGKTK